MNVTLVSQYHAAPMAAIHAAAFAPPERWGTAAFARLLAQPGCFGLLHVDGACVLARVAADEAEVLTLAVHPLVRRRGIGRDLLCAAEAQAAATGATAMFLEVADGNVPARALYDAAGYIEVGRRPRYYPTGDAAIVLRHQLTRAAAAGG